MNNPLIRSLICKPLSNLVDATMDPSEAVRTPLHSRVYTDIIRAVSGKEHSLRDDPRLRKRTISSKWKAVKYKEQGNCRCI